MRRPSSGAIAGFAALAVSALALSACAPRPSRDADFAACPAYAHAYAVTDAFMTAFNGRDMAALEATFHFPHLRIASYPLGVLTAPGQQDDVFGTLAAEGWARSDWAARAIVQCSETKAHMMATFARHNAAGAEYARYDGLYIIELRDGFWGVTARSTFAP